MDREKEGLSNLNASQHLGTLWALPQTEDLHLVSLWIYNLLDRVTEVMHKFLYIAGNCENNPFTMCSSISMIFSTLQIVHTFHNVFYNTPNPSQTKPSINLLKIFVTLIFWMLFLLSWMFLSTHSMKLMLILAKVQLKCHVFHKKFLITLGRINDFFFFLHFPSSDLIIYLSFIFMPYITLSYLHVYHHLLNYEVHWETLF